MKLSISGAIEGDHILGEKVTRASQILDQAIGPASQSVAAEWTLKEDASGRPVVLLTLADFTGARAEVRFAPEDLANEGRLHAKFYKVWGDLLQYRSHKQLDILTGVVPTGK